MKWCLWLVFVFIFTQTITAEQEAAAGEEEAANLKTLSLQQAVDLALKNNLNIEIEKFNPEIGDTQIVQAKSRFEPLFTAGSTVYDSDQPSGSILVGSGSTNTKLFDYNFSFQQLLKTGTAYSLDFKNTRTNTSRRFTSINPWFDTSLFANVTQPLMRNFGKDITLAPLWIAEKSRLAYDHRLRQQMMDVALRVEQLYWDLVFVRRDLEVKKQSLEAAQDLYENNKKQVEVGTMAPLEVVVAEAEVAAREEGIITAETLIKNTEEALKTVILGLHTAERWDEELVPIDEPTISNLEITQEEAIKKALAENPDLKALNTDLESKKLNTKLAANALKPQFDLKASLGYTGLGGDSQLYLDNDPFTNPIPIGTLPGGYNDALANLFDNPTWSVGFVFGLPIGNGAAEAGYVRADLSEKQSTKQLENAKQQLILNVRTTIRNLQTDLKRLDATRASRVLQEKKLDAERKKLNVGLSTNHVVLVFQDDLAKARSAELNAMVDYNKNRAQLERYLGMNLPK